MGSFAKKMIKTHPKSRENNSHLWSLLFIFNSVELREYYILFLFDSWERAPSVSL